MKYVDLVIDNKSKATDRFYTYRCGSDCVSVGQKVYVYFGKGKALREAYVFRVKDEPGTGSRDLKEVELIDEDICLNSEMIEVACWMRDRYLCRYIDGIKLFTPATGTVKRGPRIGALEETEETGKEVRILTEEQKKALDAVGRAIEKGDGKRFLLWGVTGSGKTEVYMRAVAKALDKEKKAIVLVPEIALAGQMISRFAARFGRENIAVLHSGLTKAQRYEEWQKIRKGRVKIAIGARSAVFAPMEDIGLIIIDEEHESTYKSDMTPKYDTVEVAIKRCALSGAVLLLGSATPSVATFYRSEKGIYERLELRKRYNDVELPDVEIVDMKDEMKSGNMSPVSRRLYEATGRELAEGNQIIYFLNRRGYNTCVTCGNCGKVVKCPECGITMTYHKYINGLECHYCGYREEVPKVCPGCGSSEMMMTGTGTEKIQEEVERLFPLVGTARLDLDTAKKKPEKILKDFASGKVRILSGTQIVAKGLDYPHVTLTGIISPDTTLNIPDYRSPERTFQLITQAAGRAGRGEERGKVIIQTCDTENYAIRAAAKQDYMEFYQKEIRFRELMGYPPFGDLIQVVLSSSDENILGEMAAVWCAELKDLLAGGGQDPGRVLDPVDMVYVRKKEGCRKQILIKCPQGQRGIYMGAVKALMDRGRESREKRYTVLVDVNPYRA